MTDGALLVMFDGPDGVGKTTQLELAAKELERQGRKLYVTHMLGGSPLGEAVRQILFSDTERSAQTNLHLCLSAYYALLDVIADKLAAGCNVLVDRSPLSLIAYQVFGDGLDEAVGFAACDEMVKAFQPSAIITYNAPPELLTRRRTERQETADYFEKKSADYHVRTVEGYVAATKRYATVVIDATNSVDTIHQQTMAIIDSLTGTISSVSDAVNA